MFAIPARVSYCLLLLLSALLGGAVAVAQDAAIPPAKSTEKLKLGTYEVGDLVVTVPDYLTPNSDSGTDIGADYRGGGFGGGGGGFGGGAPMGGRGGGPMMDAFGRVNPQQIGFDPNSITLPSLQNVIIKVVRPETWAANGTGEGQIEPIGASLVVLNTEDVHQLIAGLLQDLRHGSGARRSVSIDARWLLLNSDELDRLRVQGKDGDAQPTVDPKALADYTRRPTSLRGLTNCFSGQSVYLISGTRRNVVRSYIPVVGSIEQSNPATGWASAGTSPFQFVQFGGREGGRDGGGGEGGGYGAGGGMTYGGRGVGYQPVIQTPNFGVALKIRPTLIFGEDAVVVDLTSTITFPGMSSDGGATMSPPGGAAPPVDRLAVDTQELATTLRMPLGKPVLVGGMSYIAPSASADADAPDAAKPAATPNQETRQLYLLLEIR